MERPGLDRSIQFGLLECPECKFDYPVVDGIPILMAPHESVDSKFETNVLTMLEGPTVESLAWAVKSREPVRALSAPLQPLEAGRGSSVPAARDVWREQRPCLSGCQRRG